VDVAAEMNSKARQHQIKDNYTNVDFRFGEIENLATSTGGLHRHSRRAKAEES
jgi:hypothetical protein